MTDKPPAPCPFCSKQDLHIHTSNDLFPWRAVICMACGATGPRAWSKQEAVKLWDRKAGAAT